MDPNAMLDALQWEYEDGNFESAAEYLESLRTWILIQGGFLPDAWQGHTEHEISRDLSAWAQMIDDAQYRAPLLSGHTGPRTMNWTNTDFEILF